VNGLVCRRGLAASAAQQDEDRDRSHKRGAGAGQQRDVHCGHERGVRSVGGLRPEARGDRV